MALQNNPLLLALARRVILRAPRRSSADLREGRAAIEGRALTTRPLTSPLSGRAAACYLISIEVTLDDGTRQSKLIAGVEPFEVVSFTCRESLLPSILSLPTTTRLRHG